MKLKLALIGLAALGGAAISSGSASAAIPNGIPNADQITRPEQVRLVCDWRGVCWRTGPRFYGTYGYYGPPRPWVRRHYWHRWHRW